MGHGYSDQTLTLSKLRPFYHYYQISLLNCYTDNSEICKVWKMGE